MLASQHEWLDIDQEAFSARGYQAVFDQDLFHCLCDLATGGRPFDMPPRLAIAPDTGFLGRPGSAYAVELQGIEEMKANAFKANHGIVVNSFGNYNNDTGTIALCATRSRLLTNARLAHELRHWGQDVEGRLAAELAVARQGGTLLGQGLDADANARQRREQYRRYRATPFERDARAFARRPAVYKLGSIIRYIPQD